MLCSAPTGKSGSKWLDRLRSSKGIPTNDGLDLDSFLLAAAHSPHSLQARPTNPARTRSRSPEAHHDPPSMSTVLAELFNMGATLTQPQPSKKKCPRKQTNPKFFLASSSTTNNTAVPATNSLRADVAEEEEEEEEEEPLDRGDEEEENEKEGNELKGFTRSEVTMIDTSFPGWKVDKLVFRKNNVWKVRERKQKSKFFAKKKKSTGVNGIGTSK